VYTRHFADRQITSNVRTYFRLNDRFVLLSRHWGFYMAPNSDEVFHVTCDNMFKGDLSGDALGITACLYAYSNLSFGHGGFAQECARHYHLLREYMMDHPEVKAILGAAA
jgi:hypothetical protein